MKLHILVLEEILRNLDLVSPVLSSYVLDLVCDWMKNIFWNSHFWPSWLRPHKYNFSRRIYLSISQSLDHLTFNLQELETLPHSPRLPFAQWVQIVLGKLVTISILDTFDPFKLIVDVVAILSVYNKTGLLDLAKGLTKNDIRLLASGGTAAMIREAGFPVEWVDDEYVNWTRSLVDEDPFIVEMSPQSLMRRRCYLGVSRHFIRLSMREFLPEISSRTRKIWQNRRSVKWIMSSVTYTPSRIP